MTWLEFFWRSEARRYTYWHVVPGVLVVHRARLLACALAGLLMLWGADICAETPKVLKIGSSVA